MPYRTMISIAAAVLFAAASISTDAFAFRGGFRAGGVRAGGVYRGGIYRGGVYRGGIYRGAYYRGGLYGRPFVRPGVAAGLAVGAGAAVAAPYYNSAACGYYPYPPCY